MCGTINRLRSRVRRVFYGLMQGIQSTYEEDKIRSCRVQGLIRGCHAHRGCVWTRAAHTPYMTKHKICSTKKRQNSGTERVCVYIRKLTFRGWGYLATSRQSSSPEESQNGARYQVGVIPTVTHVSYNPFRTAVPFWGQPSQILTSFVPKNGTDCSPISSRF